jgi:hypothetical protein
MEPRPLTERERAVLDALLSVEFEGVEELRAQAADVVVVGRCTCGCPSIDFQRGRGLGMSIRVNAGVRDDSYDGLFLYTIEDPERGELLGGIEWVAGGGPDPDQLPGPDTLNIGIP